MCTDLEDGDIICPKCGNNKLADMYVDMLFWVCNKCGYNSQKG